jgi:hypothetical protein
MADPLPYYRLLRHLMIEAVHDGHPYDAQRYRRELDALRQDLSKRGIITRSSGAHLRRKGLTGKNCRL